MLKKSLILVSLLAACDGGGGGGGTTTTPSGTYTPVTLSSIAGRTFVANGPSMTLKDGNSTSVVEAANIVFTSSTEINFNGVILKKDTSGNTFRNGDSSIVLTVTNDIPTVGTDVAHTTTDQILYMVKSDADLADATTVTPFLAGNVTKAGDMPHTGTATYTGTMVLYDDLGHDRTMEGPSLIVSFKNAQVFGGVNFGGNFVLIDSAAIKNSAFTSTMSSGGVAPTVDGTINGAFFGATGQEIGGTLTLHYNPGGTPTETYVGYYGDAVNAAHN